MDKRAMNPVYLEGLRQDIRSEDSGGAETHTPGITDGHQDTMILNLKLNQYQVRSPIRGPNMCRRTWKTARSDLGARRGPWEN